MSTMPNGPEFSYIRLSSTHAKVTCACGWEDDPVPVSPFDPNEALAAASAVHPRCPAPAKHAARFRHYPSYYMIDGCLCGWCVPIGTGDPEAALVQHVAVAMAGSSTSPSASPSASSSANPSTDWSQIDRGLDLQHELALRAIAWAQADRACDDRAAALTRIEDEIDAHLREGQAPSDIERALLNKLEREKINFQLADQRAQKCDDDFRQVARKLADAMERK